MGSAARICQCPPSGSRYVASVAPPSSSIVRPSVSTDVGAAAEASRRASRPREAAGATARFFFARFFAVAMADRCRRRGRRSSWRYKLEDADRLRVFALADDPLRHPDAPVLRLERLEQSKAELAKGIGDENAAACRKVAVE